MSTRSVSSVPASPGSITCSNVILTPGKRDSSTHKRGGSTRVMVSVLRGRPLALLAITPPGRNSPSSRADSMCSDSLQLATSTHAAQTSSGAARAALEASYESTARQATRPDDATALSAGPGSAAAPGSPGASMSSLDPRGVSGGHPPALREWPELPDGAGSAADRTPALR